MRLICRRRRLLRGRLVGGLGGLRLFLGFMMADRAANGSTRHRMMPGHVAGNATHRSARHAASLCGQGRKSKSRAQYGSPGDVKAKSHVSTSFPWRAAPACDNTSARRHAWFSPGARKYA